MGGLEEAVKRSKRYLTKKVMQQHHATEQAIKRLEHHKTHLWRYSQTKRRIIRTAVTTGLAALTISSYVASFKMPEPYDVGPKSLHWLTKKVLSWEVPPIPERGEAPNYLAATTFFADTDKLTEDQRLSTTLHLPQCPEVQNYKFVSFKELQETNELIIKSVLAVEDRAFFEHQGTNPKALISALIDNRNREKARGGSSLTNQLAKHIAGNIGRRRTSKDKLFENFLITPELENKFSKEEIFELYVNTMYFGKGSYGIYAAGVNYFGKEPKDLEPKEVALLIGLLKEPAMEDSKKARRRGRTVLDIMYEQEIITDMQYSINKNKELRFKHQLRKRVAPHALKTAEEELHRIINKKNGHFFDVITSIDEDVQAIVEEELKKMDRDFYEDDSLDKEYFALVLNSEGQIVAKVGSKDYYKNFNDLTTMPIRSGSLLKTLTTAWFIEEFPKTSMHSKFLVGKHNPLWKKGDPELQNWRRYKDVNNHTNKFDHEEVSLYEMMQHSLNEMEIYKLKHAKNVIDGDPSDEVTAQDRLLLMNTIYDFFDEQLGFTSFFDREGDVQETNNDMYMNSLLTQMRGVSFTELASAYVGVITGHKREASIIKEIRISGEEEPVYVFKPSNETSVSARTADEIQEALVGVLDVTAYSFKKSLEDSLLNIYNFGAKTGTSNLGAGFIGIRLGNKWEENIDPLLIAVYYGDTDYENFSKGKYNKKSGSSLGPYVANMFNKIEEVNE